MIKPLTAFRRSVLLFVPAVTLHERKVQGSEAPFLIPWVGWMGVMTVVSPDAAALVDAVEVDCSKSVPQSSRCSQLLPHDQINALIVV